MSYSERRKVIILYVVYNMFINFKLIFDKVLIEYYLVILFMVDLGWLM